MGLAWHSCLLTSATSRSLQDQRHFMWDVRVQLQSLWCLLLLKFNWEQMYQRASLTIHVQASHRKLFYTAELLFFPCQSSDKTLQALSCMQGLGHLWLPYCSLHTCWRAIVGLSWSNVSKLPEDHRCNKVHPTGIGIFPYALNFEETYHRLLTFNN